MYFVLEVVTPGNTNPVAYDDTYSATENVPLSIAAPGVLANDGDEQADGNGRNGQISKVELHVAPLSFPTR